ncbi:MAG: hypothetical protein ABL997_03370 [Planctomycetota bacterium]
MCLEHRDWTPLLATSTLGVRSELRFFWEESFELEIVNRDYMGPDVRSVLGYFDGLLGS